MVNRGWLRQHSNAACQLVSINRLIIINVCVFRLQRLVKDLLKQLQGQDSGQWANNKVSGLDRTLGEISRILEKQVEFASLISPYSSQCPAMLPRCWLEKLQRHGGHASPLACLFCDELRLALAPSVSPSRCRVSLTPNQLAFGYWLMKTRLTVFSLSTWYQ